ncbi:MAG: hypothetical protein D6820_05380, partial [Lentisphaerae bacterium]
MNSGRIPIALLIMMASAALHLCAATPGDRHPDISLRLPPGAFAPAGVVYDITQPPFNAKPDGVTDNTAAFIRAYDFALQCMDRVPWTSWMQVADQAPTFYLPQGTYLISDTIIYSGVERAGLNLLPKEKRPPNGPWYARKEGEPLINWSHWKTLGLGSPWERLANIRFIGENRERTIIRLRDHAPGFGPGKIRPVLAFGKSFFNNRVATNVVRNLTIDTGKGNPGAVGIDFVGANMCQIHNVTIRSGDGLEYAGLHIRMAPTQSYHSDITISGFDYGILLEAFHVTHPVFEHVILEHQRKSGICIRDSGCTIVRLHSQNRCAALTMESIAAQVTILDSLLEDGDPQQTAIHTRKGLLHLRALTISGYGKTVKGMPDAPPPGLMRERVILNGSEVKSDIPRLQYGTSLHLPETFPADANTHVNDKNAVCVEDFISDSPDQLPAIRKAFTAGAETIYFASRNWRNKDVIDIPAHVLRIDGLFNAVRTTFRIAEASTRPLEIQDMRCANIILDAHRPVIMRNMIFSKIHFTGPGHRLLLTGCSAILLKLLKETAGQSITAKMLNCEGHYLPVTAQKGARITILGYKTERGENTNHFDFRVEEGGALEILGGVTGVKPRGIVDCRGGHFSITAATSMNGACPNNFV